LAADSVDLPSFEEIVDIAKWSEIETRFGGTDESESVVGKLKKVLGSV
jgi:hypothetical protein